MKAILIDELIKDQCVTEQVLVTVNNQKLQGWKIAKPLNYTKQYNSFISRLRMALLVLNGKSIAVQYFSDLPEKEKIKYALSDIKNKK